MYQADQQLTLNSALQVQESGLKTPSFILSANLTNGSPVFTLYCYGDSHVQTITKSTGGLICDVRKIKDTIIIQL